MTAASAVVCGAGAWVPRQVVTNSELASRLDITEDWIVQRTGIRARHVAAPDEATSDLAVEAGARALESAGLTAVDAVILATTTPDHPCPATAPCVAARLGSRGAAAWDVAAVCTGFLYALAGAVGAIAGGAADTVLVIGAETYSRIVDPTDRTAAAIFGDGAGALVVRAGDPDEPGAIGPCVLGSDGTGSDLIRVPLGGSRRGPPRPGGQGRDHYFQMSGRAVYRRAVDELVECSGEALRRAGWSTTDVDAFAPHQANARICVAAAQKLGIAGERCLSNIETIGNTAAASIPLLLAHASSSGALGAGDRLLLAAFGGGLTWGAATTTWPEISVIAAVPLPEPQVRAGTKQLGPSGR